jgi:hypothetical protein
MKVNKLLRFPWSATLCQNAIVLLIHYSLPKAYRAKKGKLFYKMSTAYVMMITKWHTDQMNSLLTEYALVANVRRS